MTATAVKTCSLAQRFYTNVQGIGSKAMPKSKRLCIFTLFFILWGCSAPSFNASNMRWKTYSNSRYGFEFPYPSNWNALPSPENGDGIAFVSPRDKNVEIRAWASNQPPESINQGRKTPTSINPNFQTVQGVSGVLLVEVGNLESSMTLTLTQGSVKYYWQGRSQSQEFQDYYRLFYYIAQQYRIPG